MMKQFFMQSIAFLLLSSCSVMALLPIQPSNAMIFKNLSKELSTCIVKDLSIKELHLEIIGGTEEKEFLRSEIMSNEQMIRWSNETNNTVIITPSEMRTIYETIEDDERVKRTCLLNADIRFEIARSSRIQQCSILQFSDTVRRADIPSLEIPAYPFCRADIPQNESTLFDGIIKPVIYVLTFGFSAYLLFGVRSSD
ncbi:MAG: hypothetical protein RIT37_629 [Bacteroidota bacterium]|jgi:hypothetical protein